MVRDKVSVPIGVMVLVDVATHALSRRQLQPVAGAGGIDFVGHFLAVSRDKLQFATSRGSARGFATNSNRLATGSARCSKPVRDRRIWRYPASTCPRMSIGARGHDDAAVLATNSCAWMPVPATSMVRRMMARI